MRVWLIDNPGSGAPPYQTLQQYASAIQLGIDGDFGPVYDRGCQFAFGDAKDVSPGDCVLDLVATMDQPGALGDHSPDGTGKISPVLDAQDHVELSATIDHELKELLEDQLCDVIRASSDGRLWADEPADAVEADTYQIDSVALSNFVWPSWYSGAGSQFDQLKKLTKPMTVTAGGYCQYLDPNIGWQQIQSSERAPRTYRMKHARRRLRRVAKWIAQWAGGVA